MPVTLLGPQRLQPTLNHAVADVDRRVGGRGMLAVVTAGWEERELEIQELDEHVGGRALNLEVYCRVEDIFAHDKELLGLMRERHDTLRALQELYRVRLAHELAAVRDLYARADGQPGASLLEPEVDAAIEAVRVLDARHLARVDEVHREFEARMQPTQRPHVRKHRQQIAEILKRCTALCIAGGHVGVLLHRLRLFDVFGLHGARPIIAWSAGAMVCGERVVLFHDSPPQGPGDAEVYDRGFGLVPGVVPLPHARRRLRLDDRRRVGLFARRFAPAQAVALDERTRVDWSDGRLEVHGGTRTLRHDGSVVEGAA
ncbi:MAG: Type 1 glutamine amidotransferase-like domain-containing protein [Planctomycetota bacterium]